MGLSMRRCTLSDDGHHVGAVVLVLRHRGHDVVKHLHAGGASVTAWGGMDSEYKQTKTPSHGHSKVVTVMLSDAGRCAENSQP